MSENNAALVRELVNRIASVTGRNRSEVRDLLKQLPDDQLAGLAALPDIELLGQGTEVLERAAMGHFSGKPAVNAADLAVEAAAARRAAASQHTAEPQDQAVVDFNENTKEINIGFQQETDGEAGTKTAKLNKVWLVGGAVGVGLAFVLVIILVIVVLQPPPPPDKTEEELAQEHARRIARLPPLPPPPECVAITHPWAYAVAGTGKQRIERRGLFADHKGELTIELWLKFDNPAGVNHVYLRNGEGDVQFELGCQRVRNNLTAYFTIPQAMSDDDPKAWTVLPQDADGWLHLYGSYDLPGSIDDPPIMRLYVNGRRKARERGSGRRPRFTCDSYVLHWDLAADSKVVFDAVRISADRIRPEKILPAAGAAVRDDTRALLQFDKFDVGITADRLEPQIDINLSGGTFVASGPAVDMIVPDEAPAEFLDALGKYKDVAYREKYEREWPRLSELDRKRFLRGLRRGRWPPAE